MNRNPHARWRQPKALHRLVAEIGERLFEVVRLPTHWPNVKA